MRSPAARFLLILAALWLPLQAVAGIAMDIGAKAQAAAMDGAGMGEHCAFHDPAPEPAAGDGPCDDCGVCHLAGAGYVPVAEIRAGALPAIRSFAANGPLPVPSRSPEPPQHPPKRSA
ncbi:MAG: hypothetical protein OEL88_00925 [Sterolibacteriaceae bacterium MAG5]|nr:hypothetical protein [Candidatus Nitricoxidireducens bremensis]